MKIKARVFILLGLFLAVLGGIAYKTARDKRAALYAASSPAERGWMIMQDEGCVSCHQADSGFRAPVLKNLYGKTVKFVDGTEAVADAEYIRQAIVAPMTRIVAGYQAVMPNYQGKFTDDELEALIAAMKPASVTPE